MANHIRQTKQGECEPLCTYCKGEDLRRDGYGEGKQRYRCRTCGRRSYGLPPDMRPKCPSCRGVVREQSLSDGRSRYLCPACRKHFLSEYKGARPERDTARRVRHPFSLCLNRRARLGLSAYVQATRSTDPQAVRAIFRHVLTGQVFSTGSVGRGGRSGAIRICREPASASVRFPDLRSESAKKSRVAAGGGHAGQRFQPTVLVVQQIRVFLDDEAKEGLVHAMRWLSMNHADAARWLLANVKMPGVDIPGYLGLAPTPWVAGSGGKKRRYEWEKGYDPDWDD